CLAGDCPHCLATIDGISYTRTCQTLAMPGMLVDPHPLNALPPLPSGDLPAGDLKAPCVKTRHIHCDVVVIGMGEAGRAAAEEAKSTAKRVTTLDIADG